MFRCLRNSLLLYQLYKYKNKYLKFDLFTEIQRRWLEKPWNCVNVFCPWKSVELHIISCKLHGCDSCCMDATHAAWMRVMLHGCELCCMDGTHAAWMGLMLHGCDLCCMDETYAAWMRLMVWNICLCVHVGWQHNTVEVRRGTRLQWQLYFMPDVPHQVKKKISKTRPCLWTRAHTSSGFCKSRESPVWRVSRDLLISDRGTEIKAAIEPNPFNMERRRMFEKFQSGVHQNHITDTAQNQEAEQQKRLESGDSLHMLKATGVRWTHVQETSLRRYELCDVVH